MFFKYILRQKINKYRYIAYDEPMNDDGLPLRWHGLGDSDGLKGF